MTEEEAYLQLLTEIIELDGHAVQFTGGDLATGTRPFAYTIGLHTQAGRGNELAVSGLGPEASRGVLDAVAEALALSGLTPTDGLVIGGALQGGYALRLRPVSRPSELGMIRVVYGNTPPIWQIVWPDREFRFPGDRAYGLPEEAQPML
ncbi:DUF4262 domain-containing protein [Streptomyces sp. NBC_00079]|uniref:DUF4262 domain-containing protein n=1 Tax=Streptomyces sp. NBC_00079 TaxID=2975644 RepID=UPI00324D8B1B